MINRSGKRSGLPRLMPQGGCRRSHMQITIMGNQSPHCADSANAGEEGGKPAKSKRPVRAAREPRSGRLPLRNGTINQIPGPAATAWESTHPVGSNKSSSNRPNPGGERPRELRTGPSIPDFERPTTRKVPLPASLIPAPPE